MSQPPEPDWIEARLIGARPQVIAALLRYFRDLDLAEEAFQESCLRALKAWPKNGPPRDAAGWLIMVGRNAAVDQVRRQARLTELPGEEAMSDYKDMEPDMAERLDAARYRDDILRLLFVCCHPELPATQQIALALRVVSGLPVSRIASAFVIGDRAMEQRITRAKARIAKADIPFETPGPKERAERFAAVATMIYLVFNEGYTDGNPSSERANLCEEAIRLSRLMLRLFPAEPESMGLLALMLLQHSRQQARFDEAGAPILLEDQDRSLWNRGQIAEALAMIDKAMVHRQPGPYQIQAAIAALHARAERAEDTDWAGIDRLYEALEHRAPSPRGDPQPLGRNLEAPRRAGGAGDDRPPRRPAGRILLLPRRARDSAPAIGIQCRSGRRVPAGYRPGEYSCRSHADSTASRSIGRRALPSCQPRLIQPSSVPSKYRVPSLVLKQAP